MCHFQSIFQNAHGRAYTRQTALADLRTSISLHVAEKVKSFQQQAITKSCHVAGTSLQDSSGSWSHLHTSLLLHSRGPKDVFIHLTNIIPNQPGQTKTSATVDRHYFFFLLNQTLMVSNLHKLWCLLHTI